MTDRLHPQSLRELEQLVKLHGTERLIAAIREIDARLAAPRTPVKCDKCDGPNSEPETSNYCPTCRAAYQTRIAADPETRPVGVPKASAKLVRCNGRMRNGPEKRYARCTVCGAIDWEQNEGDKCRAMVPKKAKG